MPVAPRQPAAKDGRLGVEIKAQETAEAVGISPNAGHPAEFGVRRQSAAATALSGGGDDAKRRGIFVRSTSGVALRLSPQSKNWLN